MPLDLPVPSTPPTDPDPSTPPPPALPALHCEAVWRQTFLAQFADPHGRDALQRFGDLLYTVTLGTGYPGERGRLFAAEDLEAVADDLAQLAAMVREISEVPAQCEVGGANLELCGDAKDWDGKLRDMAHEIRCRVREVEGGPAPGAVPVPDEEDVPLGQDIRDSDRIARRLADHHPDPEGASDLPAARRVHRRRAEGRS